MNKKDNLRSKKTKRRIVKAYLELKEENPDKKIQISALCDRCGIVRSSFYHYYKTTDELYPDMIVPINEALNNRRMTSLEDSMIYFSRVLFDQAEVYKLLFTENTQTMVMLRDRVVTPYLERYTGIAERGTVKYLRNRFLYGGVTGLLYEGMTDKEVKTPEQIGTLIAECMKAEM